MQPNQRLVTIATDLDMNNSVSGHVLSGYVTWDQIKSEFSDSTFIRDFFEHPSTINQALYIVIYRNKDGEFQRRMGITPKPENDDKLYETLEALAASLGFKLSLHHGQIKTTTHNMLRSVAFEKQLKVKNDCCLYELLFANNYDLDQPFENLTKVKALYLRQAALREENALAAVGSFLQNYIDHRDSYYRFADKFTQHLHKTSLKLPQSFLQRTLHPVLIEFPFAFRFGNFQLKHAYLSIFHNLGEKDYILSITSARYDQDGTWDGSSFLHSGVEISSSTEDIESSLEKSTKYLVDLDGEDLATFKSFVLLCVKAMVYLKSAEPNIQREPGAATSKSSTAKLKKFYRHNRAFDSISVGYGYHGLTYSVDSTVVRGFFRWQRFGPGLALVKLIWIDEHSRNYRSSVESSEHP